MGILIIIGVNLAAYVSKYYSPNRDDARLKEVERLIQAVPPYPGSEEGEHSSSSKFRGAHLGKVYKSDATYDDLKGYYTEIPTQLGWHLERERNVKDWWRDLGGRELISAMAGTTCPLSLLARKRTTDGITESLSVGKRDDRGGTLIKQ